MQRAAAARKLPVRLLFPFRCADRRLAGLRDAPLCKIDSLGFVTVSHIQTAWQWAYFLQRTTRCSITTLLYNLSQHDELRRACSCLVLPYASGLDAIVATPLAQTARL
jgi:hypothetical protein